MNKAKLLTIGNYLLSGLLWVLGILTFVFNLLGKWTAWHLAGFGFYYCIPFSLTYCLIVLLSPACPDESVTKKRYLRHNTVILCVTIAVTVLTLVVSAKWFW